MEIKLRESYYLIRQAVKYLIKEYGENGTVYVYFRKNSDIILLIEYGKLTNIIKDGIATTYKTTLKNLYLYLFTQEYINTDQALLVYLANKELKKYSSLDIQILLGITKKQLEMLEAGLSEFQDKLSFDNVSKKMNFEKTEFTKLFRLDFKKVTNEK